jgi:iron complex outermembrane receptor protein
MLILGFVFMFIHINIFYGGFMKVFLTLILMLVLAPSIMFAASIKGKVVSKQTGKPLISATVILDGQGKGARTDVDGNFVIENVSDGKYVVQVSYIGYEKVRMDVDVAGSDVEIEVRLAQKAILSQAVSVVASRALNRETPVAFSDIEKEDMTLKMGSRDLPMILNETPGVYASENGGGYGDSRINIRGFDQRNISVMINGVPVNDMENGWVYWSNWDGLADVTSSIQVQRGLGAGLLSNPSVGGTMNIITDPAQMEAGATIKQEVGRDAFLKTTLMGRTGDLGDFSAFAAAVKKTADGVIDKAWSDAWAYYLGMSWQPAEDHSLELYLIGAPQLHGQRSYKQNAAVFDRQFAIDNGYTLEGDEQYPTERGITYNYNWGLVQGNKNLDDWYQGSQHDRRDDTYLNERENYYHKPQANINWHWDINEDWNLTNVFYVSIGTGGGSGPLGDYLATTDDGQVDFQAAYDYNTSEEANDGTGQYESASILRNSVNNHYWMGWIGAADVQVNKETKVQFGGDYRFYRGEHYREVRNLLGGDYFIDQSDKTIDYNANPGLAQKKLGDIIAYHNDGIVNQIGGFATFENVTPDRSYYLNASVSNTSYTRFDYFRTPDMPNGRETDPQSFLGYTIKGGANFNLDRNWNVFGNVGYYSRAPLFRNVYYYDNSVYENITNEKILAFELGTGYWTEMFSANANAYLTRWDDRSWYTSSYITDGEGNRTYFNYNLPGLNQDHMGFEFEGSYKPIEELLIKAMFSLGFWEYRDSVNTSYSPDDNPETTFEQTIYVNGLKVGDSPQKTFALSASVFPIEGLTFNVTGKYFWDYFANFDPIRRTTPPAEGEDPIQSWEIPAFFIMDLHLYYKLPLELDFMDITIFGHGFNILDQVYVSDADDGSNHDIMTSNVYMGNPMVWNFGVQIDL